jgi:hypothetical protein
LKHALGEDYLSLDERPTPEQSIDVEKLDRVTVAATNTLKDRAMFTFQRAVGDPKLVPFREHLAAAPIFYHGPNKNN